MEQPELERRADLLLHPVANTRYERFVVSVLRLDTDTRGADYYRGHGKEAFDAFVTNLAWPVAFGLIQLLRIPAMRNDPDKGLFDAGAAQRSDKKTREITGRLGVIVPQHRKIRTMELEAHREETLYTRGKSLGEVKRTQTDPRITPYGRLLRPTSLDELPQVMDIRQGHLSWVGPRLPSKNDWQEIDRLLQEGDETTAQWVENGKNGLKFGLLSPYGLIPENRLLLRFDRRIAFDVRYGDNANPLVDLRFVFAAPEVVIFGKGAK